MNETEFRKILKEALEKELKDYKVEENRELIYKVIIDENLKYNPREPNNPTRGNYAFQTDIVIAKKQKNIPLVIIETKYGNFNTHDVITYSTKALKHKEIYPYIRYGLVVGGKGEIDNRFFTHNVGFDFAFALGKIDNKKELEEFIRILKKQEFIRILKEQLESAESLLEIHTQKEKVKGFSSKINMLMKKSK
jgi:hypothetical protein